MITDAINEEDSEVALAINQLETVEKELSTTIIEIIRNFSALLAVEVDKDDWEGWWVEGWFREFCRSVRVVLCSLCIMCATLNPLSLSYATGRYDTTFADSR